MKSHTLTLQKADARTKRTPPDWDHFVFSVIRESPTQPEVQRVEKVLTLIVNANTCLEESRAALLDLSHARGFSTQEGARTYLQHHARRRGAGRVYREMLDQLHDALHPYEWHVDVNGDINGFGVKFNFRLERPDSFMRDERPGDAPTQMSWRDWEYSSIRMLVRALDRPSELVRLRRCSACENWFFAATGHQRFCNEKCRRQYVSKSDEFKEKRRNYMRETYRPREKREAQRSLANLKKSQPKRTKG